MINGKWLAKSWLLAGSNSRSGSWSQVSFYHLLSLAASWRVVMALAMGCGSRHCMLVGSHVRFHLLPSVMEKRLFVHGSPMFTYWNWWPLRRLPKRLFFRRKIGGCPKVVPPNCLKTSMLRLIQINLIFMHTMNGHTQFNHCAHILG